MRRITNILLLILTSALLSAQTYQAESASYKGTLQNGVVFLNDEADYVTFTVNASAAGNATIYVGVQSPYGDKVMNYQVNSQSGTAQLTENASTVEVNIGSFSLSKGNNTVKITPNWTWFGVDYIRVSGLSTSGGEGGTTTKPSGKFTVSGNNLLDGNGKAFRMMGANLAYAWFKGSGYSQQMEAMKRAGANAVRIAVSDGGKYTKDPIQTLQGMIQKAEDLKMILILEVHDATGSDSQSDLHAAANYWVEMKSALVGHEATVIINIANEWIGTWKQYTAYLNGYKSAIQTIRNAGLKHCLMVDAAGWGQEVSSLTSQANNILSADPDRNIIFSVHMYGTAGAPGKVATNINNLLSQNIAFVIGEFGWYHSDGDVDEDAILTTTQQKGIGCLAWSWWGNGGGLDYLDLVSNQYDENSYTTQSAEGNSCNWGQKMMNAWKTQATVCSVYTAQSVPSSIETTLEDFSEMELIAVYDLMGRRIANSDLHALRGIYIAVYQSSNQIITKKIMLQ